MVRPHEVWCSNGPGLSNTTTAAMLLPIGLGMLDALGDLVADQSESRRPACRLRFGTALMLMISYGAGVGGLLTPIGTHRT